MGALSAKEEGPAFFTPEIWAQSPYTIHKPMHDSLRTGYFKCRHMTSDPTHKG